MTQIVFVTEQVTRKISVGKINSADDLMNLLKTTFEISEDIIGVTDTFGKFYDIQFVASHLTTLHLRKFNIVTVKAIPAGKQRQSKLDNGKHGSRNNFDKAILVGEKDEHCLGVICDLTSFGAAYRSKQAIIVICSHTIPPKELVNFNYFWCKQPGDTLRIYQEGKLNAVFPATDWKNALMAVEKYLKLLNHRKLGQSRRASLMKQVQKSQSIAKMREQWNALQSSGLLSGIDNNNQRTLQPNNYFPSKPTINGQKQSDCPRSGVTSSQQQARLKHVLPNKLSLAEKKQDIPIRVRLYNNVIETVTTSYPLTIEQQQSLSLLFELQLKGLATEKDVAMYRKYILEQNKQILELFEGYCTQEYDQVQLSKRLKNKVRFLESQAELLRNQ